MAQSRVATPALAEYLDSSGHTAPYAIDWGVRASVVILTEGRMMPREVFEQTLQPGTALDQAIESALEEDDPVFISQTEASSREVILDRVFESRKGVPAYYIFRISASQGALD